MNFFEFLTSNEPASPQTEFSQLTEALTEAVRVIEQSEDYINAQYDTLTNDQAEELEQLLDDVESSYLTPLHDVRTLIDERQGNFPNYVVPPWPGCSHPSGSILMCGCHSHMRNCYFPMYVCGRKMQQFYQEKNQ